MFPLKKFKKEIKKVYKMNLCDIANETIGTMDHAGVIAADLLSGF